MTMNADQEQSQLRASFGELRREDERRAPSFDRTWQAAVRLSHRERPLAFPLVRWAAVAAIVAMGVAIGLLSRSWNNAVAERTTPPITMPTAAVPAVTATPTSEPGQQSPAVSIEDWESPTAALLDLSGEV